MALLALASMLAALAANVEAPPPLEAVCGRAMSEVKIDGCADEPAWKDAAAVTDFRLFITMQKPTEHTEVRFCYDEKFLYAVFICSDKDVFALYEEHDAWLWESDAVELFFKPTEDNPIYYEFEIAPNNAVFDARMVNTGSGGFKRWASWDCDLRTAVTVDGTLDNWQDRDTGYCVEMAIPLDCIKETIGDRPLAGQRWKFAAVRVDYSVTLELEERSATANVPDGNLHLKSGYSTLVFE
jgi:hypothetical protein